MIQGKGCELMKGNGNIHKNDIYKIDLSPVDKLAALVTSKGVSFEHDIKPRQEKRGYPLPTKIYMGPKEHDLRGRRFGRLVVCGYLGKSHNGGTSAMWDARCDCGNFEKRRSRALKNKNDVRCCQYCERLQILRTKINYRHLLEFQTLRGIG